MHVLPSIDIFIPAVYSFKKLMTAINLYFRVKST